MPPGQLLDWPKRVPLRKRGSCLHLASVLLASELRPTASPIVPSARCKAGKHHLVALGGHKARPAVHAVLEPSTAFHGLPWLSAEALP